MKGFQVYKEAERLGPEALKYMIQWFIGSVDCVHEGFTDSKQRPDYPHADWAVKRLEDAFLAIPDDLKQSAKSVVSRTRIAPGAEVPSFSCGELIRVRTNFGGWRVLRVVGIFLGGTRQQSVIELESLDLEKNTEGRMCVPEELLKAAVSASTVDRI